MQSSFTDMVGTAVVPADCFDNAELTDLAPFMGTVTAADETTAQASVAKTSYWGGNCS